MFLACFTIKRQVLRMFTSSASIPFMNYKYRISSNFRGDPIYSFRIISFMISYKKLYKSQKMTQIKKKCYRFSSNSQIFMTREKSKYSVCYKNVIHQSMSQWPFDVILACPGHRSTHNPTNHTSTYHTPTYHTHAYHHRSSVWRSPDDQGRWSGQWLWWPCGRRELRRHR